MTANDIKNLALTEINHETISNWSDDTNTDIPIINQQYPLAVEIALTKYPWSFAFKYASVSTTEISNTDPLAKKYKRTAQLPTDCLGYVSAYTNENFSMLANWVVVGSTVYTNQDVIYLKYISSVTETVFPGYFIDWFKTFLACRLNSYLNGDMQRQSYLEQQEPYLFRAAKNIDSKLNRHQSLFTNPILSSRGKFGSGVI